MGSDQIDTERPSRVRIDKWLWAARFFKTRSLAAAAIAGGHVEVNGERAKRARGIQPGDRVRVQQGPFAREVVVCAVDDRRGSASAAAALYEETAASRAARERVAAEMKGVASAFGYGRGKPTKRERRRIDEWRGRG